VERVIVLVCGGRNYTDKLKVWAVLHELHSHHKITHIIQGGATGADSMAAAWANSTNGVQNVCCDAPWPRDGKPAGHFRNVAMLALKPALVIAFPGGKGTADMVRIAKKARVPVREEI
jgi:hypothetical protein